MRIQSRNFSWSEFGTSGQGDTRRNEQRKEEEPQALKFLVQSGCSCNVCDKSVLRKFWSISKCQVDLQIAAFEEMKHICEDSTVVSNEF